MDDNKKDEISRRIEDVLRQKNDLLQIAYTKSLEQLVEELKIYQYELEFQNEELRRIQLELENSRGSYRDLFENAPVGYVVLNETFLLLQFNRMFRFLAGLSDTPDELGVDFRRYIAPSSQDDFHFFWQRLIQTGISDSIEIKIVSRTGDHLIVKMHGMMHAESIPGRILISLADITEENKAQKELEGNRQALLSLNEIKDKFFSVISHDLRGPVGNLMALTRLLTEEFSEMSKEEIREIVEHLTPATENVFRLLENLLEWAQLQQKQIKFRPEIMNLKDVIGEALKISTDAAMRKGVGLSVEIPDELSLRADHHMLQSIIRNLLSNAIKFTSSGGHVSIAASLTEDGNVEITITDSGIGMNQENLQQLFLPGFTERRKGTAGEPSTGVGLLLTKEFLDQHKGSIHVTSQEGTGTTFRVILPS